MPRPRYTPPPRHEKPPSRAAQPGPSAPDRFEVTYGVRAGLAVFARRRDEIVRVLFAPDVRDAVAALVRWCAQQRVECREASPRDLAQSAGSDHHEGLCVTCQVRKWTSPAEFAERLVRNRGAAIALDRVRNPYNIGAILRSAAFFGLDGALLGTPAPHPGLPPDAVRVAEGGVEHLALCRTTDLADSLARMRTRGVQIVGTDGHAQAAAAGFAFVRPSVLVLGHEREGLSDRIRAQCDAVIAVRGSGAVDSLNVAVATGVLIAELTRPALPPAPLTGRAPTGRSHPG